MPVKNRENSTDVNRGRFVLFTIVLCVVAMSLGSYIRFPAGDSWTHGWTVAQWLQGDLVLNDWASAIALPQQIIGWIIHWGSDNLSWARLSVITALISVLGCAIAARLPSRLFPQWRKLHEWAPLLTILILAQTFTIKIAAGFMTDGYYLFFLAASLYLLIGAMQDSESQSNAQWVRKWIGFAALATLAALQRTHGVLLLLIVPAWILLTQIILPVKKRSDESRAVPSKNWWLPLILTVIGLVFSLWVITLNGFAPARSSEVALEMRQFWTGQSMSFPGILRDRMWLIFGILQHLGLALFPIVLLVRIRKSRDEKPEINTKSKKVVNLWYVIIGAVFIVGVLASCFLPDQLGVSQLFPYVGNSLTEEGFGPRTATLALTAHHEFPEVIRMILTILGSVGGLALIWLASRLDGFRKINWRSTSTLIGLIGLAHLFLVLINIHFFDRYLLPLMPFAFIWLAPILKDVSPKIRLNAWVFTLLMLGFSIWGTSDYLRWTGAKWDISNKARVEGISSDEIVCGYEPDGFLNFENENYPGLGFTERPAIGVWWVDRLGLGIMPEYVVFEKGADPSGTMWEGYVPTEIENERMQIWTRSNPL